MFFILHRHNERQDSEEEDDRITDRDGRLDLAVVSISAISQDGTDKDDRKSSDLLILQCFPCIPEYLLLSVQQVGITDPCHELKEDEQPKDR